jgi:MerR family copper efflux transcriptional regulator
MNIGQAAEQSGISAKMIRHYESIGLIEVNGRSGAGYRLFNERDIHLLRFIRQSRNLGFSLDQIRVLLSLWQDSSRASSDVKKLAQAHIAELDERIATLTQMRNTLSTLSNACSGSQRPDCPILRELAQGE